MLNTDRTACGHSAVGSKPLANAPEGVDCYLDSGTVVGSHNLIETDRADVNACGTNQPIHADPKIAALANNGGSAQTFA